MEQPRAAQTEVEAAAAARSEALSILSTRQLLEELHLPLPLYYRAEGVCTHRQTYTRFNIRNFAAYVCTQRQILIRLLKWI